MVCDDRGSYSVEEFCAMYSRVPESVLSPPTYHLRTKTSLMSNSDILKLLESKHAKLRNLNPTNPELVKQMLQQLSLEYTQASCHIEGNPLSWSETELVITQKLSIIHSQSNDNRSSRAQSSGKQLTQLVDYQNRPVDLSTDARLRDLSEQPYTKQDFDEVKNHEVCYRRL